MTIPDSAWCNDYYYRNKNPKLRTLRVAADAKITPVETEPQIHYRLADLKALQSRQSTPGDPL